MRTAFRLLFAILCCILVLAGIASAGTIRVDVNAAPLRRGSPDGLSWRTAYHTIQEGINKAGSGDEIWVATGTYNAQVAMKDNVALYGGFLNTMTSRDQRNWNLYPAIVDGMGGGSVVTIINCPSPGTRVDGFTVRNGTGQTIPMGIGGGGFYAMSSAPTIANNTITGNNGPGLYGAGIYSESSQIRILGNTISGNNGSTGVGIALYGSSPVEVFGNIFSGNIAINWGGAIYCRGVDSMLISNNVFTGNTASNGGAISFDSGNSVTIDNNYISNNHSSSYGGGIHITFYD